MYTLIYAVCFYISSLLITIPFLRYFKHHEARLLSLLTLSTASFLAGFFVPFKISFYVSFLFLMLLSLYTIYKGNVKVERDENVFLAVFAFFIFLRFLNPQIFDAEKFMDSAFMNAILKASSFPPSDPFLAGEKLDFYYYFGHLIGASITLLSLSPPEVGYNVAVAALPAYTSLTIYGMLKRRGLKIALSGVFLAVFSGNLYSFLDFFSRIFSGRAVDFGYYWNCTRVIASTINEFPYFSFIHADLHAHVVAIPIITLIFALIAREEKSRFIYSAIILSLFTLFATNSWHYPLALVAVLSAGAAIRDKWLVFCALLSAAPAFVFFLHMNTPAASFLVVKDRSEIHEFILYAFTPVAACYILTAKKQTFYFLPLSIPLYFLSPVLAVLTPLLATALIGIFRRETYSAIMLSGLLAFITPDFFAVESRMNTVFKFYIFAWLALMISASMKAEWKEWKKYVIVALLVIGIIYPLAATPVRYSTAEMTLDGMSFMRAYDGDYYAVKWLQKEEGVIIEEGCTQGSLCGYQYGGRVAAFTGNPAVIAWTNHEYAWRRNYTLVAERAEDVRSFYTTESCEKMNEIVEKYGVKFIFLGYEEKRVFSANPERFERCFEKVFERGGTYIFVTKNLS